MTITHPIPPNTLILILGDSCGCVDCGGMKRYKAVETMVMQVITRADGFHYKTSCSNNLIFQDNVLEVH
jgi:hypothetical protein